MFRRVIKPSLGMSAEEHIQEGKQMSTQEHIQEGKIDVDQEHIQEGTIDVDTRTYTERCNRFRHKDIYRKVK